MANVEQLETLIQELNNRIDKLREEKWDIKLTISAQGHVVGSAELTTTHTQALGMK